MLYYYYLFLQYFYIYIFHFLSRFYDLAKIRGTGCTECLLVGLPNDSTMNFAAILSPVPAPCPDVLHAVRPA